MKSLASESKPFQSRSKVRAHFPEHWLVIEPIRFVVLRALTSTRPAQEVL